MESLIDAVGYRLVPMYQVIRPTAVALLVLFLVGILKMLLDIVIRVIAIARIRGCEWWLMGALWGHRRGGRPSAPKMQLNNLDRLVNWSNKFLARRETNRVCSTQPRTE
jgi:hypothetical protein